MSGPRSGSRAGQAPTLDDLRPAPYNPRRLSERAASALRSSLAAFGDIAGITWNRRTGRLVSGHQRIGQLRALHGDGLRIEEGSVVVPGGDSFPIRVVDWDEATERAANVAANSPTAGGDWSDDLGDVLAQIEADLPGLYGNLDLADLLGPGGGSEPGPGEWADAIGGIDGAAGPELRTITIHGSPEEIETIERAVSVRTGGRTPGRAATATALAAICAESMP